MFENLELVRTVVAAGGREATLYDLFVPRRPSTAGHFWSQRVRQAYDEIARPGRMAVQLALLPIALDARADRTLGRARGRRGARGVVPPRSGVGVEAGGACSPRGRRSARRSGSPSAP